MNLAWIEGFAIFLAVFIVVFVGSYNDYSKEEQFFKLYALDQEGKFVSIFTFQLFITISLARVIAERVYSPKNVINLKIKFYLLGPMHSQWS